MTIRSTVPALALPLVLALTMTGCAQHAARDRLGIEDPTLLTTGVGATQNEAAGAPTAQWINTYAPIGHRAAALENLQRRVTALPGDTTTYFPAKAQCWIDAGRQALSARDGWGFVEEAIGQAATLTAAIESGATPSAANPALRTVSTVRPDLWKIVNAIKADPATARCPGAQAPLACAEVDLIRAGHYAWTRNFSAAENLLPAIQRDLTQSAERALQCAQPPVAATHPATPAAPQTITLRADSAFRFGGSGEDAMLPSGKAQLDAVAHNLQAATGIRRLTVTGYTDRLGGDAYNRTLSLQRAQTVRRYLEKLGVVLPTTVQGRGNRDPLVSCAQQSRAALLECLAPNRRVEIGFIHDPE